MSHKTQKIVSTIFLGLAVVLDFFVLIKIANLHQVQIFYKTAFFVWLLLSFFIVFIYDLHFKNIGCWHNAKQKHTGLTNSFVCFCKVFFSASYERLAHLGKIKSLHMWLNYLLLPSIIFWSSSILLQIKMGYLVTQYIVIILSSLALTLNFWYLKEIFYRKTEKVEGDIFVRMSVLKIYASAIAYCASLYAFFRQDLFIFKDFAFCLPWQFFSLAVFTLTFLLIYQALFQHHLLNIKTFFWTVTISFVMSVLGYFVLKFWSYNLYTAAVFMTICYNLMWGVFHFHLDRSLTWKNLLEILILTLLLGFMVLSVTNFHAKLADMCTY